MKHKGNSRLTGQTILITQLYFIFYFTINFLIVFDKICDILVFYHIATVAHIEIHIEKRRKHRIQSLVMFFSSLFNKTTVSHVVKK